MLKQKDLKRATLIEACINGKCTVKQVAYALGISERRVKQIKKEVKENGVKSIQHGNRGRKPKNTIPDETRKKILELRSSYEYEISNFKHFQELLKEHENIEISYSALYNILKSAGIKSPKKHRKTKLHHRRKRKEAEGMMLQADGTPFDWFETGEKYSLHGFVDDATGKITGLYMCKNECLLGYLEVLRQTLENFGIPISLYPDKYSVFFPPKKVSDHLTIEEQLNGRQKGITQFGRIVEELGIEMFPASSPQAKGRIERLWETLQSRLVTEFRINKITNVDEANKFLIEFIKIYNSKFSVEPSNNSSVFLKLPKRYNLDELLCVKFERTIDNAGVFSINNSKFQILDRNLPPKTKVQIYLSQKIGMRVKVNSKTYDVAPLEVISKDIINSESLDYHQYFADVVIDLLNEFYLKDAKAS
ncbi:MAG: ISNCY family transposase [Clostridia bacterium]|nr:ISNCY family transposase [Clostridia bacterium]